MRARLVSVAAGVVVCTTLIVVVGLVAGAIEVLNPVAWCVAR